eukprot:349906-Chlamydomonas_euryale.AAC.12
MCLEKPVAAAVTVVWRVTSHLAEHDGCGGLHHTWPTSTSYSSGALTTRPPVSARPSRSAAWMQLCHSAWYSRACATDKGERGQMCGGGQGKGQRGNVWGRARKGTKGRRGKCVGAGEERVRLCHSAWHS